MTDIQSVHAREVLDSRGNPTVEAEVLTENGWGRAAVPSGASTGQFEAVELRDGDKRRYLGKGVLKAVQNIETQLGPAIVGMNAMDQVQIDHILRQCDGTDNKSKLGANAILAVSMATARAAADALGLPLWKYLGGAQARRLPTPLMNILNGGVHADSGLEIQEFMIIPHGGKRFSDALRMGVEIFHTLKGLLKEEGLTTSVGDEGGFAPHLKSNQAAIEFILRAIEKAGYKPGEDVSLGLDCAMSEFYDEKKQLYTFDKTQKTRDELIKVYDEWAKKFPIVSIEDGCAENDALGWKSLTETLGRRIQLVGDDLFVTNPSRFENGIREHMANAILIKLNQIGTVTETLECIDMGIRANYGVIVSHRSGETEDTFIADLAVASQVGQIKTGSACRSDRLAKYNELLRIEDLLGSSAVFAGKTPFLFANRV